MSSNSVAGLLPSMFDQTHIAPETQAFNAKLEQLIAGIPTILELPAHVLREARAAGKSFLGPVVLSPNGEERSIDGPAGRISLRVFATTNAKGVLLHLHGGGFAFGAHDQQDAMLDAIAATTGLAVVSVGYRLTPEHPYPAANDDCEAVALWLANNALREFGSDRCFIGGESAGAHLAVTTMLRLRDRHGLWPFRAAYLSYGAYDLSLTPSARNWGTRNLVLSTPILSKYVEWFGAGDKLSDPDVSPLHASLNALPPALFSVGTLDPLLDDTLFMSSRWIAAGNTAELCVYPGGVHGFNALPGPLAGPANARIVSFLKRHLAA